MLLRGLAIHNVGKAYRYEEPECTNIVGQEEASPTKGRIFIRVLILMKESGLNRNQITSNPFTRKRVRRMGAAPTP